MREAKTSAAHADGQPAGSVDIVGVMRLGLYQVDWAPRPGPQAPGLGPGMTFEIGLSVNLSVRPISMHVSWTALKKKCNYVASDSANVS